MAQWAINYLINLKRESQQYYQQIFIRLYYAPDVYTATTPLASVVRFATAMSMPSIFSSQMKFIYLLELYSLIVVETRL